MASDKAGELFINLYSGQALPTVPFTGCKGKFVSARSRCLKGRVHFWSSHIPFSFSLSQRIKVSDRARPSE